MNLLFLCTGNSCRSQMAEGWARALAPELAPGLDLSVQSAGLEAHGLNPSAVAAMARHGVDISAHSSDILNDQQMEAADIIVTVCSHADAHCPMTPPGIEKVHLPFFDPASATGSDSEIQACFDKVCMEIKQAVEKLLIELAGRQGG